MRLPITLYNAYIFFNQIVLCCYFHVVSVNHSQSYQRSKPVETCKVSTQRQQNTKRKGIERGLTKKL